MDVVIIEDEKLAANDLASILKKTDKKINIRKILSSVNEAVAYFKISPLPQLIFSDIQLGDGYSFEIFKDMEVYVPVIYCTAHDKHALEAFRYNGIAYILKPYGANSIRETLEKCRYFQNSLAVSNTKIDYDVLLQTLMNPQKQHPTILVNYKDKIIPFKVTDIAFFFVENRSVSLVSVNGSLHRINNTLDEMEQICGKLFYRANRQYLINKNCVKEAVHYSYRKLFVSMNIETTHEIIINKVNIPAFLNWLQH